MPNKKPRRAARLLCKVLGQPRSRLDRVIGLGLVVLARDVGVVRLHPVAQWGGVPKKTKPWKVTVRWESSPPIQAAVNSADDLTKEDLQRYYVISLVGDARITGLLADNRELGILVSWKFLAAPPAPP